MLPNTSLPVVEYSELSINTKNISDSVKNTDFNLVAALTPKGDHVTLVNNETDISQITTGGVFERDNSLIDDCANACFAHSSAIYSKIFTKKAYENSQTAPLVNVMRPGDHQNSFDDHVFNSFNLNATKFNLVNSSEELKKCLKDSTEIYENIKQNLTRHTEENGQIIPLSQGKEIFYSNTFEQILPIIKGCPIFSEMNTSELIKSFNLILQDFCEDPASTLEQRRICLTLLNSETLDWTILNSLISRRTCLQSFSKFIIFNNFFFPLASFGLFVEFNGLLSVASNHVAFSTNLLNATIAGNSSYIILGQKIKRLLVNRALEEEEDILSEGLNIMNNSINIKEEENISITDRLNLIQQENNQILGEHVNNNNTILSENKSQIINVDENQEFVMDLEDAIEQSKAITKSDYFLDKIANLTKFEVIGMTLGLGFVAFILKDFSGHRSNISESYTIKTLGKIGGEISKTNREISELRNHVAILQNNLNQLKSKE
jgi:hypothetical protein